MSIRIQIDQIPSNSFSRSLLISRKSGLDVVNPDTYDVFTYEVELFSGEGVIQSATFEHRWGDDLITLMSEAITVLGGPGGPMTTGMLR